MANNKYKMTPILWVAIAFLVMAILAAIFGIGGVAGLASPVLQWLVIVLAILFIVLLIAGLDEQRLGIEEDKLRDY